MTDKKPVTVEIQRSVSATVKNAAPSERAESVSVAQKPKPRNAASNVLEKLSQLKQLSASKQDFYRAAFRLMAEHFAASYGLLHIRVGATPLQDDYQSEDRCSADVMAVADAMIIEAEADSRANVRLFAQPSESTIAVLSAPLYAGADQVGTLCLATRIKANKEARVLLSELIALIAFLGSQQQGDSASPATSDAANRALQKALKYASVTEFAYTLVNSIATKIGCEQVAFGVVSKQQAQVLAVSGLDRFSRSSHGIVAIQQAMEECADAGETIVYQLAHSATGDSSFLLHRQWHRSANNASLLSIPIQLEDQSPLAVVSMQRSAERPLAESEVKSIEQLLAPFAPAIHLLEKSSRGVFARTCESASQAWQATYGPGQWERKIGAAAVSASLLFFLFGWIPHRVSVPCRVEPTAINHVSAPFQASIREVFVQDGTKVVAGQALARLDAKPFELERDRLLSEMASHQIDMDRSLSERNVGEAAIAASLLESARMQLNMAENRILQTEIVSPVDGVVIRGELDQRVGQLLQFGEPLVEIGQTDGMNVRLDIPEHLAHFVEAGDAGRFASFSQPGQRLQFQIDRITPVAVVENEKNVFVAEAKLSDSPDWLRFGMEGTAKVKTGWKPAWWVATHGMINRIRMALWL